MDRRNESFEQVAKAHRTRKGEGRREGSGGTKAGVELPARSYTDDTGVADLGVDEPVVAATAVNDSRSESEPTGDYAGETEADRQEEDAVRWVLEERIPRTKGAWKARGRIPSADRSRG